MNFDANEYLPGEGWKFFTGKRKEATGRRKFPGKACFFRKSEQKKTAIPTFSANLTILQAGLRAIKTLSQSTP